MEIIKWANKMGYTIKIEKSERLNLIDLLKEVIIHRLIIDETLSIEIDGDIYELEIINE